MTSDFHSHFTRNVNTYRREFASTNSRKFVITNTGPIVSNNLPLELNPQATARFLWRGLLRGGGYHPPPWDLGWGLEYKIVQYTVGFSIHFCTEWCIPIPITSREPEVIWVWTRAPVDFSQYVTFAWANICYALKIVLFSVLCIYIYTYILYIVCMHTCMHTHIHTYLHTYTHAYINTMYTCIHTYISTAIVDQGRLITGASSRTFLHTCVHIYIHTYMYTYIHTYIYTLYIHIHVYTCIHT